MNSRGFTTAPAPLAAASNGPRLTAARTAPSQAASRHSEAVMRRAPTPVHDITNHDASPSLLKLVVKPTIRCFHRCGYCAPRQQYYNRLPTDPTSSTFALSADGAMPRDAVLAVIQQGHALGMRSCLFSGGDPLLHPHIVDFVRAANRNGTFVFLNSVGSGLRPQQVRQLLDAGLQACNFSLDAVDPRLNDEIRGSGGAHAATTAAIDMVRRGANSGRSGCYVNLMTVITSQNFRGLPDLVEFAAGAGLAAIYLMNVYGDSTRRFLLTTDDIADFRGVVAPRVLKRIRDIFGVGHVYANATDVLASFFSGENPDENYARGIYWATADAAKTACSVPTHTAHIEPNGDVLPCCMLEISHDPAVGSLATDTLAAVWRGLRFEAFRRDRIPFCVACPVPRNRTLGLLPEMCRQFP